MNVKQLSCWPSLALAFWPLRHRAVGDGAGGRRGSKRTEARRGGGRLRPAQRGHRLRHVHLHHGDGSELPRRHGDAGAERDGQLHPGHHAHGLGHQDPRRGPQLPRLRRRPGRERIDTRFTFEEASGRWSASAFIDNVLDKTHIRYSDMENRRSGYGGNWPQRVVALLPEVLGSRVPVQHGRPLGAPAVRLRLRNRAEAKAVVWAEA